VVGAQVIVAVHQHQHQNQQNQKKYILKSADIVKLLTNVSQELAAQSKHQSQLCHQVMTTAPLLIHVILDMEIAMEITLVDLA
jgi:hypothetical protein